MLQSDHLSASAECPQLDFTPVTGKVLIRKDKPTDITKGGIVLGKTAQGRVVTGEILSGERKGKRIVFNPGISSTFEIGEDKVSVIFEYDVIAEL